MTQHFHDVYSLIHMQQKTYAMLFIIFSNWKQTKCPLVVEWVKNTTFLPCNAVKKRKLMNYGSISQHRDHRCKKQVTEVYS